VNWFEKHLHLTVLAAIIALFLIGMGILAFDTAWLIGIVVAFDLLFLVLLGWVLRQKGQTLWFLVALVFLWWVIFLIPNKNTVKPVIEYNYDDEPPA
jgi:hypothetical protein